MRTEQLNTLIMAGLFERGLTVTPKASDNKCVKFVHTKMINFKLCHTVSNWSVLSEPRAWKLNTELVTLLNRSLQIFL